MAIINPEWIIKQEGSFQTAEEMNVLASAVKNNAVELQTDVNNLSAHVNNKANPHEVTKIQLDLENVDNVSDANKPVSIAQAEAIAVVQTDIDDHEANLSNPHEVTKAQVGLSEVDNTSDLNKPISIAQQTAINAASTTFNNHVNDTDNPHSVTKVQLGLSNVDNTSDLAKPISTATQNALATKENISNKGIAGGYAGLDANGKVPENQLPSSTNDVLEYVSFSYFPSIGEFGKIYIAKDTNKLYRWESSTYIYIKSGAVDSVAGKVGIVTLDKTDVGLPNVDNTSDINKPISTATQTALNLKTNQTRSIISGSGLTGGGDLSADRTINVAATDDSIVVAADGIKADTQNSLTSTSTTKPLAANQGKILNDNLTQLGADLGDNIEPALAEIINHQNGRIKALEDLVKNMLFKSGQFDTIDIVKQLNIWGGTNLIIIGTAAPSVVPDFVGQFFINTTVGVIYQAKGNTYTSDWKQTSN